MATAAEHIYTPEEYLALERGADHRSEYIHGRIYAMAGASRRHNLIVLSLGSEIRAALRGRPCEVYANDMRVKVVATDFYTYPDVVAVCGTPEVEDRHGDTLLNPSLIIEVLSDSTERYDRGETFAHYRRLESLREYVLVSQDEVRVQRYVRDGERWVFSEIDDLGRVLPLESIDCTIPLREVYAGVEPDAA
ncbi:MAG TPA: Uma2 family endonuclease [Longimicrobium sp.]|nr:Uma2 family endonuclease [Longimicrobium sp.]